MDSLFPTRVMTSAGWVLVPGKTPPPDTRSEEQKRLDHFDSLPLKNHLAIIKRTKADLRRILTQVKKGKASKNWKWFLEYHSTQSDPKGWKAHIDYVNQRFDLNIPKDLLTDKERERSQTIITQLEAQPRLTEEG